MYQLRFSRISGSWWTLKCGLPCRKFSPSSFKVLNIPVHNCLFFHCFPNFNSKLYFHLLKQFNGRSFTEEPHVNVYMHQLALQVKSLFKAVIMLTCQIIVWLPLAPIFPTRWFWGVVKWSLSRVSQTSDNVLFTSSLQWWLCCIQDVPNQQNDHIYVTTSQKEPEVFRWMTCTFFCTYS